MPKASVYELAKEIGVDVKILIEYLSGLGANIKSQTTMVDETYAELARRRYAPANELPTLKVKAVQPRPVGMPPRSRGPYRRTTAAPGATQEIPGQTEVDEPTPAAPPTTPIIDAPAAPVAPATQVAAPVAAPATQVVAPVAPAAPAKKPAPTATSTATPPVTSAPPQASTADSIVQTTAPSPKIVAHDTDKSAKKITTPPISEPKKKPTTTAPVAKEPSSSKRSTTPSGRQPAQRQTGSQRPSSSGKPSFRGERFEQKDRPERQSTPSGQRGKRSAGPGGAPPAHGSEHATHTPNPVETEKHLTRVKRTQTTESDEDKRRGNRRAGRPNIGRPGKTGPTRSLIGSNTDIVRMKKSRRNNRKQTKAEIPMPVETGPKKLVLPTNLTVADLATMLDVPASTVIKTLMSAGVMAAINHVIDYDVAAMVAQKHDAIVEKPQESDQTDIQVHKVTDQPSELASRPPVITILGHVDHGKTTLLDAIRETKVVESEAGGITQHIGAYQVEKDGRLITFLDTPGHEAFTEMRSRGAQVTDIAILVVAADDGVMPQTREAIHHARSAEVPIIVAINKIDRPGANPDRVKQQLSDDGLLAEDWGGDTVMVEVSALQKSGIDDLLEMILLVADMRELKANPSRPAEGRVIEAELDKNRGPVATILVQNGMMHLGDALVTGMTSGKVRAMFDYRGRPITTAGPSTPVAILGLEEVPAAGDLACVVEGERIARQIAQERLEHKKAEVQKSGRLRLSELFSKIQEGEVKDLNIVLKADVQGTAEALAASLEKLTDEKVRVNVIHSGAGGISETDVALAAAANGIIIGFNVRPDPNTRRAAEREDVDIRLYRIIYEAIDDVKAAMTGMLDPTYVEVVLGRADVRATFRVPNIGTVAGCYVSDGKIVRNSSVRVLRDSVIIFEGKISSLKRFKDDAREVAEGYECGIGIERFNDIKEGDVIEAYQMQEVKR